MRGRVTYTHRVRLQMETRCLSLITRSSLPTLPQNKLKLCFVNGCGCERSKIGHTPTPRYRRFVIVNMHGLVLYLINDYVSDI